MIDTVRINIKAGNGGNGCVSFLREKYRPKGGPNGGDGGTGGSAYLVGDNSINTLLHLKYNSTFYVERGQHGKGKTRRGANGKDTFIRVPIGTMVWRLRKGGGKEPLADVIDDTPRLVAKGGRGGWGNAHYVSSTNQEPMLAQRGEEGEYTVLMLELKLLADVGIIAKPNAGKSTFISYCSAARPRIADYPFTTVEPALGVASNRGHDFVLMEIPGLIEGAHRGVGLGHQFLRHAERARVYIHLLDGMAEDPVQDFRMIQEELRQFSPSLARKPQIVALNKVDVTEVQERAEELQSGLRGVLSEYPDIVPPEHQEPPVYLVSAASGEGTDDLLGKVVELLNVIPKPGPSEDIPEDEDYRTRKRRERGPQGFYVEDGVFVVESEELERLTATADTRDYRVLLQIWREMTRRGLAQQLEEAGIEAGDTIRIGNVEMEWF